MSAVRRSQARRGGARSLLGGLFTLVSGLAITAGLLVAAHVVLVPHTEPPPADDRPGEAVSDAEAARTAAAAAGRAVAPPPAPDSLAVPPPYTPPASSASRDVTPPGLTRGPLLAGPLERVPPPPATATPPRPERFRRVIVVDGGRIRAIRDERPLFIAIAGVAVPAFSETCRDRDGETWRCGAEARADLARLVGGRDVLCTATPADEGDEQEPRTVVTDCAVGRYDLATWLAGRGWAKPEADAPEPVQAAAAEAEAERRGIWR